MFTKKSHADIKKLTLKIQDCKKDSTTRLRHLKTILDFVDIEEAKSIFEINYSHVYYILYDTFVQAESNLKRGIHKAYKEELDGSLWLLGKILCLLPELLAKRWQCHSLSHIISKILHPGNSLKLRKEGVKYFLLWYQALGQNAPPHVHAMFAELVPGLIVPQFGGTGPSEIEAIDFVNHPNMKAELGGSVFHDNTSVHPVQNGEILPILPPSTNERTLSPDPRDGLEILLNCIIQTTACLYWRDNVAQKHVKCLSFLLDRFKSVYVPVFCSGFDFKRSIYEPKLDLPTMRVINKKDELMSPCVVVLINWISKFTRDRIIINNNRIDNVQIEDDSSNEYFNSLSSLRLTGCTQTTLIRDVLYSTRENINFIHEVYRQSFLLGFTSKSQIETIRTTISVYRDWMTSTSPPQFLLDPDQNGGGYFNDNNLLEQNPNIITENNDSYPPIQRNQRSRNDSYIGAITKENIPVRAGLQKVLQVFVTNAANVFLVNTANLNIVFPSKNRDFRSSPLNEQTDICKKVLNVYRTMVMNTRMDAKTWEQLLLVLLQISSVILNQAAPTSNGSKSNTLGGRLGQAIFQTLIVTWIRAHTNVPVNPQLWEKFLGVLTSLTHREELIIEWDKTMQTLTRVLARYVYNLNLQDLPLDRLAESKGKRRRFGSVWQQSKDNNRELTSLQSVEKKFNFPSQRNDDVQNGGGNSMSVCRSPSTPLLNRSYSEGSLASTNRKSRPRRRLKNTHKVPALSSSVEHSLSVMLSNASPTDISISSETMNSTRISIITNTSTSGGDTLRRALSLDSIHPKKNHDAADYDEGESRRESRTPSPTASSGIEGGSIKDSPMQIDVMAAGTSGSEAQDDGSYLSRRSIILGGTAGGWMPDIAAIMWKRMLGSLGNINRITRPELHAQVFKHLVDMTTNLIKIKQNQGIIQDNQSTPTPVTLTPPLGISAPWCYGTLTLEPQFKKGKMYALQILCLLASHGGISSMDHLPLFYNTLHRTFVGEDRDIIYAVLKHLEGPRFLSLLLPGHTLLHLDIIHTSAVLLTSLETGKSNPRAEVSSLLGSLLCYPPTVLPKPVLQPSEQIALMECPDFQEHVLNIVLRCARREPSSKARCIALTYLSQWILQQLFRPIYIKNEFSSSHHHHHHHHYHRSATSVTNENQVHYHPRIKEVIEVLLQAIQFKHRIIAVVAADSLRLCAERGKEIATIEKLPQLIINAICRALEIQNTTHPKESDKAVLTSLILCLGEFCMAFPNEILLKQVSQQQTNNKKEYLILTVLRILHQIAAGIKTNRIKLLTADEDFDMTITSDDITSDFKQSEPSYQTEETTQQCISVIKLCAKTVAMHLITHLGHFPIGIGPSRLSSLVDEQDDLSIVNNVAQEANTYQYSATTTGRDSIDFGANEVLTAQNVQLLMLNSGLVASFIELPTLKLPGGGITAGLVTADKQVRVLLRDLNGKSCWDASILYSTPKPNGKDNYSTFNSNIDDSELNKFETEDMSSSCIQTFQIGRAAPTYSVTGVPLDPLISTINFEISAPRHTLRHRPPNELPTTSNLAPDLDQLDDLLQYVGYTSPECLSTNNLLLNSPGLSPLGNQLEAQAISIITNERLVEQEYIQKLNLQSLTHCNRKQHYQSQPQFVPGNFGDRQLSSIDSTASKANFTFHYCRLLFSHLGLAGWEKRSRTHLLKRSDKLLRELRNVDMQKCRETHKVAVIYVASGQEDKNSILKNSYGSSAYEMFVSALGWEVELETHNGFLGGLPRQGCGTTSPYYATPLLEVIYHVATRMPCDTPEAILNKTRHLGNDEVHIVWSEHYREYRRDILPTEFCDVLIVVYPLKNGLFRITVNRKQDVPWFGPLSDESVLSGACLASLVRATAINASRAKRSSMPFYQQFYEERNRSLETVSSRYKESTTFEELISRICNPGSSTTTNTLPGNPSRNFMTSIGTTTGWSQNSDNVNVKENLQHNSIIAQTTSLDNSSPKPQKKLHPFKSVPKKSTQHQYTYSYQHQSNSTPPESPTLLGKKTK